MTEEIENIETNNLLRRIFYMNYITAFYLVHLWADQKKIYATEEKEEKVIEKDREYAIKQIEKQMKDLAESDKEAGKFWNDIIKNLPEPSLDYIG